MTRKLLAALASVLLCVGLTGVLIAQSNDMDRRWNLADRQSTGAYVTGDHHGDDDDEGCDDELGDKIAGTWLGTGEFAVDFECDGIADAPPTVFEYDSQSFTASGFYGATNPSNPYLGHGTWKQTGCREATTNNIVYLVNPDTGALDFILRIPGVFTFDSDYQTATSTFGAIGFLPGQDPLDPTEVPLFCTIGQHYQLRKVNP